MVAFDAKGADDDVGGFADGDAQFPQPSIVAGGLRRQCIVEQRNDGRATQCSLDARGEWEGDADVTPSPRTGTTTPSVRSRSASIASSDDGAGIGSPAARISERCPSSASIAIAFTSSRVRPAMVQPGKSTSEILLAPIPS
jgi:hypothetical protein